MNYSFLFLILFITCCSAFSQSGDSSKILNLAAYGEIYYQYDFDNPSTGERPAYIYNHKRHNEPAINLALLKASLQKNKWRANLALMGGDYSKFNLAAEPDWAECIYEANIEYLFNDKFSIDAGILPSHIGFESAISKESWTLSRSLLAENSPYYETGIKFNYAPNKKWTIALLGLNGWQHIKDNNSSIATGTQVRFKPNNKWLFNSSTFFGNEKADSVTDQLRLFHDFYASYAVSEKINMALFFDYGIEEKQNADGFNKWLGFVYQFQWKIAKKISAALRYEYFKDKTGVIIAPVSVNGFRSSGLSANIDGLIFKNILWRNELRLLYSPDKIFAKDNISKKDNICFLSSLAVWFN